MLLVAVAFVAGALIGFAGGRVYSIYRVGRGGPDFIRTRVIRHLDSELHLTPAQHDQISQIMERHHRRMQEIAQGIRPQMRQEIDAANGEIEAVLTPDQRTKFNSMRMRMERFMPHRGRHHEGPGGEPPPGL
jgi:Spy/CpxP family protein refolding chaperone